MHFIEDVDFIFSFMRRVLHFIHKISDVIHFVVGGSILLHHVKRKPLINFHAHITFIARFSLMEIQAVQCFGHDFRTGGFTCSSGSAEKIGMTYAACSDLVFQCRCDVFLTNDIPKNPWSPLAV